jgi:hypothetical protein
LIRNKCRERSGTLLANAQSGSRRRPALVDVLLKEKELLEDLKVRLRLYRIDGGASHGNRHRPLLIDRFPFTLCDPAEWSPTVANSYGLHECCEIKQVGDTLYVADTSPDESTRINGRTISVAPLLPGDRITLNTIEFVVSYERMTSAPPLPTELLFQETVRPSQHSKSIGRPASSAERVTDTQSIASGTTTAGILV